MRVSLLLLGAVAASADESSVGVNPIRKVVTMLQKMQKKVEAEGEKEKELFDKFMCYCKNGATDLGKSISDSNTHIPELQSTIEESISQKAQLEEDLKKHQTDRAGAKSAMAEATALREKEAGEFAGVATDLNTDIAAIKKATAAIELACLALSCKLMRLRFSRNWSCRTAPLCSMWIVKISQLSFQVEAVTSMRQQAAPSLAS
jgi:chromosome segregation ATPase